MAAGLVGLPPASERCRDCATPSRSVRMRDAQTYTKFGSVMIEGEESPLGTAAPLAILRAGTPDTLTVFRETGYRRRSRQA
jgi:hypothetical protein